VLLCGLPGAGKTTLARQLEAALPAVRLCADDWMTALAVDLYDADRRARLEATFWSHARRLLELGTSVVLENGFWHRAERDEKLAFGRSIGASVELRFLDVPLDERWRRVDARNRAGAVDSVVIPYELLASWDALFERPTADELACYDPPAGLGSTTTSTDPRSTS